jgi:hypothetical protein
MSEGQFLYELADRTGVRLLIDVANLHTNHVNQGEDPARALAELPLEALAYVHVAGGFERDGVWHDSHAHPVPRPVLDILTDLASRVSPPGVLLERDENFPGPAALQAELRAVREAVELGRAATGETAADTGQTAGRAATGQTAADTGAEGKTRDGRRTGGAPGAACREGARQRLGVAQTALLSALVAGTPAPEGFDRMRLGVQARALASKRAGVVAKVAPELPLLLGEEYRAAFLTYAHGRPMRGGYRQDAMDFVQSLLLAGRPENAQVRRELRAWWRERSGPAPRSGRPSARVARAARRVLLGH